MPEAVIASPVRTPVGGFGGMLRDVAVAELARTVVAEVLARTGVEGAQVDDVVLGQCYPNGEVPALGRIAALDAGLPVDVPGRQVDRRCGSGLQAICDAAMMVEAGVAEVVIAGGAESMSQVEHYTLGLRWSGVKAGDVALHDRLGRARITAGGAHYPVPGGMLETAENVRRQYGISREEQDELALRSHQRAVAAQKDGRFDDEIVPVTVQPGEGGRGSKRRGDPVTHELDEHPRPETSLERLAKLRAVLGGEDPEATVTAGNASGQNDGAAACLVTTREFAEAHGLAPLAAIRGWAVAGVEPKLMGMGPVPASAKVLDRLGLKLDAMDLIELNEAFAAQVLGVTREWGFGADDFERLNVNGSGISLGHPVGATGCRILATLLYEMARRDAEWALETMCIGGGQGLAAVIQRVA